MCRRCRGDGFHCDGYMQAAVTAPVKPPKVKKVYIPPLPPPMTTNPSTAAFEQRFFHHFRDSTIKDLAFPSYRINFWYDSVLPPAQGSESVRHALVALGAAHWLFLTRHSPASPAVDEGYIRNLILDQYNKSIHHLTSAMRGTNSTDTEVTLICCLVFYCLENILGHYTESLRH